MRIIGHAAEIDRLRKDLDELRGLCTALVESVATLQQVSQLHSNCLIEVNAKADAAVGRQGTAEAAAAVQSLVETLRRMQESVTIPRSRIHGENG